MSKKSPVLKCQTCNKRFSEEDVEDLNFYPDIATCFHCCEKEKQKTHVENCFGKKNIVTKSGTITAYGYDPDNAIDCSLHCDFRRVCSLFARKKIYKLRAAIMIDKAVQEAMPFKHKNSIIAKSFLMCLKGTTRRKLIRFIRKEKGDSDRIIRIFRKGYFKDRKWLWDEDGQDIRISLPLSKRSK